MGVSQTINGYKLSMANDGKISIEGNFKNLDTAGYFNLRKSLAEFQDLCWSVKTNPSLNGATVIVKDDK